MSSKIGTILSLLFVTIFFLFGVDLLSIQISYANLDSKAITISYLIAKNGSIDNELVSYIENTYDVEFECLSNCTPLFGDVVDYTISSFIDPLVISQNQMKVSLKRQAIIGYFN